MPFYPQVAAGGDRPHREGTGIGRLRFGIDVGGTFTDVVAYDEASGELASLKLPTDPADQAVGLAAGIRALLGTGDEIDGLVHGTTVVTNALLEGRGAAVTLVTTEGFRDTLEIGRLARERLYDLRRPPKPAPLVPRHRRLEAAERLAFDGRVLRPLDTVEVERVVAAAHALGAEAVAICLLHSYANPEHEQLLAEALAAVVPYVSVSSEINAELRELDRTSTTVLNAAVMPVARRYVERLVDELTSPSGPLLGAGRGSGRGGRTPPPRRGEGVGGRGPSIHLVQSSGGMMSTATAAAQPLRMVMSGPAAGVAAAQALLRSLTIADAVTFDMGGTSTDVCLIAGGLAQTVRERSINGWKVRLPSVAVESIGAGGGSVAWLDPAGALKVGPRSAGARPGPAAYAQGGAEPTVTDANVALGLIRPGLEFGGGAIRIDADLARRAMVQVAEPLGLGLLEAAAGLVEVANAGMLRAIRLVSVQRGIDPRDLALVAYGGAGPLHAARLARALGIPRVVVPAYASTFSALGCLASELRYDLVQTYRRALAELESAELAQQLARLEAAAAEPLRRDGHAAGEITTRRSLDLRYTGQNYELEVPLEPGPGGLDRGVIRERFLEQHRRLYSYATDEPVECTALRVVAFVPGAVPKLPERRPRGPGLVEAAYRCWMPGHGEVAAMVYRRAGLGLDESIAGPALVEDEQSTTVVLPGMRARTDRFGNLHLESAP